MANPRILEVDTAMGGVWVFGQLTPQSLMWLGFDGFLHRKTMGKPWENHRKMAVEWDLPSGQHLHKNELGEITMLFSWEDSRHLDWDIFNCAPQRVCL